jgi:polyisoprenoid-binding protein YceI
MRILTPFQLVGVSVAGILLLSLGGCPTHPQGPEPPSSAKIAPLAPPQRHEGRPFDVSSSESLLTILAFRGGTLAKVGHNHVIASHDVSGSFYVPEDPAHSTFELHIPVEQLAIDEPDLRVQEGPDFPKDVPDSAREGTRRNMLSEALLNGAAFSEIVLTSQHIEATASGSQVRADVQITVRGQTHTVSVPVNYSLSNGQLTASGELPLKQTELGLTPFTAMLGALAVQDEMIVKFRFVAHEAKVKGS